MILNSARVSRVLLFAIIVQCYDVSPVRSSYQVNNYAHTTNTVDSGKSKTLPVWVIIIIVLLVLTALCFCIGMCCYRLTCGKKHYGRRRRHTRVMRVSPSHINHPVNEHFQGGTESTTVCISGENPINKEDKQVGQLSSMLYQSEAPPRYEDVIQLKSTELDKILNNDQHQSTTRDSKSPPPNYQCHSVNVTNV